MRPYLQEGGAKEEGVWALLAQEYKGLLAEGSTVSVGEAEWGQQEGGRQALVGILKDLPLLQSNRDRGFSSEGVT